jgi:hypothetical protein
MRAYLAITGLLFALVAILHVWRLIAEWSGFDDGFWFVSVTAILAACLSYWAWRLFADLIRQE